jgi:hypothetical protein
MMDFQNFTSPTTRKGLTKLNLSYLEQADAFKVNEVVRDWPLTANPFVRRMAQVLLVGGRTLRLELGTFMEVAGLLTSDHPTRTYTFSALLAASVDAEPTFSVVLINSTKGKEPPILADNAGFFQYAMKWFSSQSKTDTHLTFSVTANALFWVH